jgi:undecaprenyl-diphosphatase
MLKNLLETDAHWSARLRIAEKPGPLRRLAIFLAHSGDSWFWGIGLVLVWWLGDVFWKHSALWIFIGIAVTAIITQALKWLIRRERPEGNWGALYRNVDPHSFPSGHSSRVAMLAVLGLALGPTWFALLLGLWAPLVALARVSMGVHYLSDVLAGAALGIIVGLVLILLPVFRAPLF